MSYRTEDDRKLLADFLAFFVRRGWQNLEYPDAVINEYMADREQKQ